MSDKIYPIGIQNFEKLRKEGYFYIDKTALIYKMVKTGSYYFLSRPRRFGKSLRKTARKHDYLHRVAAFYPVYKLFRFFVAVFRHRTAVYYNNIRRKNIVCFLVSVFVHSLCYRSAFILVDLAPEGLYGISDNITSIINCGEFHQN